ncbi:threonine synthase [Marinilabiliaceae bacterium ANBcel2]|nr:threonine synthase [Marinilabiliaceae bacterium ANBcel2]
MKYISLKNSENSFTLKEAVFKGLAPDGSLFMPEKIPILSNNFINNFHLKDLNEIAYDILKLYVDQEVPSDEFKRIVDETFNFKIPLKELEYNLFSLELFHGPTLAFKDVGARFLSRLLGYFNKGEKRKLMVLTATSGDTGGAVANGFHRVPGIEVVVLYPKGKISPYQEYQIAGPGDNVHAIAVDGSFDDCQRLVKEAFNDSELREQIYMTSANSINIGRLLPQMVYYFYAIAQLRNSNIYDAPVITVPSGNFGNITAAMIGAQMGMPVKRFVAATNENDVVPRFLLDGVYSPHETIMTIANAMDVGDPSNFPRMYQLYNNSLALIKDSLFSASVTDNEIKDTIVKCYKEREYLMDPHSASAYNILKRTLSDKETGFFVSTAHPFKFSEVIEDILPGALKKSGYEVDFELNQANKGEVMKSEYSSFKKIIENLA